MAHAPENESCTSTRSRQKSTPSQNQRNRWTKFLRLVRAVCWIILLLLSFIANYARRNILIIGWIIRRADSFPRDDFNIIILFLFRYKKTRRIVYSGRCLYINAFPLCAMFYTFRRISLFLARLWSPPLSSSSLYYSYNLNKLN